MDRDYFKLNNKNTSEFAKSLKQRLGNCSEIVLVCIGSMLLLGDSVAPRIGSELHKLGVNYAIYGDRKRQVHAKNLEATIEKIKRNHENALIIAIDACIGEEVGEVIVHDGPLLAGAGLGKKLSPIGDISIKCVVANDVETLWSVAPSTIMSFIKYTSKGIWLATN